MEVTRTNSCQQSQGSTSGETVRDEWGSTGEQAGSTPREGLRIPLVLCHTQHILGSHLCTHTPVCRDLLLAWGFSKVPLDTALGTPAQPNRDISAQVAPNQLLIWISEWEESKEPGGMAWRTAGNHTDDPASCGVSLFNLCTTLPHTGPIRSIFSPFSPGQQPQGSVCPRKCFLWTLGGTREDSRHHLRWEVHPHICAQGKCFRTVVEQEPVVLHCLMLIARANEATHPSW